MSEPVIIANAVSAFLIALESVVLPISTGAHIALAGVLAVVSTWLAREQTVPVASTTPQIQKVEIVHVVQVKEHA